MVVVPFHKTLILLPSTGCLVNILTGPLLCDVQLINKLAQ